MHGRHAFLIFQVDDEQVEHVERRRPANRLCYGQIGVFDDESSLSQVQRDQASQLGVVADDQNFHFAWFAPHDFHLFPDMPDAQCVVLRTLEG